MTARMTAAAIAASVRSRFARSASVRKATYSLAQGEQVAACTRQRLASSPLILPKAIARIVAESGQPFRSGFGKSFSNASLALLRKSSSCLLEADLSLREGPFRCQLNFPAARHAEPSGFDLFCSHIGHHRKHGTRRLNGRTFRSEERPKQCGSSPKIWLRALKQRLGEAADSAAAVT